MQGVVGVLISILLQIYRFDRIMVMSLWPIFCATLYISIFIPMKEMCVGVKARVKNIRVGKFSRVCTK